MSRSLMCHVVAGYPDADTCLQLMRGLQEAGATAIEVQIPFSDPIADGETIMQANDAALAGGMTTTGSFSLIAKAREQGLDRDVYIMSYLQKVQHQGIEAFCRAAADCGARGLIIPDVPYESPEHGQLVSLVRKYGLELVPVLSPGMSSKRLAALLRAGPKYVYVTSRRGITGSSYAGTAELDRFVAEVRRGSNATVMIGFGIATAKDVDDVLRYGDIAVVGSAIIKKLQSSGLGKTLEYAAGLTGAKL